VVGEAMESVEDHISAANSPTGTLGQFYRGKRGKPWMLKSD